MKYALVFFPAGGTYFKGFHGLFFYGGVPDQPGGEKGKKFLSKNLQKLLISVGSLETTAQKEKIRPILNEWKGDHVQPDDILLTGIRV